MSSKTKISTDGKIVIAKSLGNDFKQRVEASKNDVKFGFDLLKEAKKRSKKG